MSVKNQYKTQKKFEFEKESVPPKDVVDIASQTNSSEKQDGSCQTDSPERQDFQVQTNGPKQSEPIATQTENSPKCDFQSQANIQSEGISVAVSTIKEEVAMPNIPNSAASIPAKKRKLSSSSSARTTNQPSQSTSNGAGDQLNNVQAVDEAISNSEVYKIYCRNEDPKEAIKQIKELKTCIYFDQATQPTLAEDVLKRESEKTLNELWKIEPKLDDSKFTKIKKYTVNQDNRYNVETLNKAMSHAFDYRFTRIRILLPNGYEFWYVSNIEEGPGLSKWYRADSTNWFKVSLLAQLNVMGITDATIQKLQYNHYLKEKSEKTLWFDFADFALYWGMRSFFPSHRSPNVRFDIVKAEIDNENIVIASVQLTEWDDDSQTRKTFRTYEGKSIRPLKKTRRPKEEKENEDKEMKIEAKKAAMIEFFKERFGFTEFKDMYVDELHRSIDI